uniref:Integrase, catalytic region, zinc finger, CCHC-type, peptidase aspartic, catalytic n=1 Tax=Tanacetum cinerariifolium TaxID=118510 RepID=A0A699GTQ6_TANCI|nr:integrase, catalytic region, zinc finger, CCHC-type, peptidase aspartic, catalytic [Tanacetum cinerariifolium]
MQWTGYVKRHLKSMGVLATIQEGNKCTEETKAKDDVFLHQHIDEMLEFEYSNCDGPSILKKDLEIRFNNQRKVFLPYPRDEQNNLRFQDFKKTILLGLPEDVYAAVDSCETAQEIWLHYTQLYDFLKYNQKEVDDLRAERLVKTHDPLALMENSNNPFNYLVFHQDQPSSSTYMQQPLPNNNNYNPQPSFNQNYMQQPMPNLKDITDPTTAMNMALVLMAKAFKLNYSTPTNNNQRISSNPRNRQIAQPGMNMGQDRQMQMVRGNGGNQFREYDGQNVGNQNGYNAVQNVRNQNLNGNGNVVAARAEGNATGNNGNQIRCYNYRGLADLDEIEEVNANCILMANLQQASTSGTQIDKAPVYDSDGSAENDSNVIYEVSSVEQDGEIVDQHPATVEEERAYFESLYNNLAIKVEKVNSVNRKMKETNADLTTEIARYKNQEKCFELSQEKYDKLERVDNTAKTRKPQPRSNTKNDRVPSESKSSFINKEVKVEHPRNLLLSKNKKHMSSECNNIKLAIQNDKSKVVCAMCKQCLITSNHDVCVINYVNDMNSPGKKQKENVSNIKNNRNKSQRVYLFEGLRHNLFSVGQFYDSDLEVTFRRNTCFVRNLEGVNLLKGNRTTNLYTINLNEMASPSPICIMARTTSTKSWLWHQHLSHLNFDTINDLARNDLVTGLPKFKYHKEHLCPSYLCGPMRIASINGKRYVLVIVDDYSRYTWNDRKDIGKLGTKGDIGFFIGYSADSCAYRVYDRRTKKIMETMNVTFDELSTMAFEQSTAPRTVPAAQVPQVCSTLMASTTIADTAPTSTSSSSQATNVPSTSHDVLVPTPDNITPLTLKWLFKNKHDEENTVIQNQTHLVVRGYRQEKGIDFKESFALVAKIEAIRIFLAYAVHKSFTVFQMDVKTAFLHEEMTFFLGLQVNQSLCGIFINQSNYVLEILKKYGMKSCDPVFTPMEIKDKLDLDQNGTPVDATNYRSMIGALMYLTSSRPDIVHATCLSARHQAKPTKKHLMEVKRIFRYSGEPLIRVFSIRRILVLNLPDFQMLIMRDVKTPSRVLPAELNT